MRVIAVLFLLGCFALAAPLAASSNQPVRAAKAQKFTVVTLEKNLNRAYLVYSRPTRESIANTWVEGGMVVKAKCQRYSRLRGGMSKVRDPNFNGKSRYWVYLGRSDNGRKQWLTVLVLDREGPIGARVRGLPRCSS